MSNNENQRNINDALINQSVIDLLIEKKIFTKEELAETLQQNLELFKKLAKEYSKLLIEAKEIEVKYDLNKDLDEDVLEGLYYGPMGEA
jgi:hypothetical protein|tara:strand:+ start:505 stop:771 length:267 start_codon:yes stop_codon:yes gene_type:complete